MIRRLSCIRLLLIAAIVLNRPIFAQVVLPAPEPLLEWKAVDHPSCYEWDVSLSMNGDYVVMCDGPRIVVVNTKTKKHKIVHEDPSIASCWTCPQTGGLFVVSMPRVQRQASAMELGRGAARLDYLAKPADWFAWKVTWSLPIFYRGIGTQFLGDYDHLAILEREPHRRNKKGRPIGDSASTRVSYVRLLDRRKLESGDSSAEINKIEVPGLVGGLEWMGKDLVVVYSSEVKGTRDFLISKGNIDIGEGELKNRTALCRLSFAQLSRLPRPALPSGNGLGSIKEFETHYHPFLDHYLPQLVGNRVFRFRGGPQPGDLERLVDRMRVDPTFRMRTFKRGVLDKGMSTLGDLTLYSHDPQTRQPFWYLDNSDSSTHIADVVPKDGRYQVLTVDRRSKQPLLRILRIWDIDPKNP